MVTNQAYLFLIFIATGVIISILFDFFRILRKSFKTSDIITYIEDLIFWILTGMIILYSIFTFNNGEIRLFIFLAIVIGSITYMVLFSSFVIKVNVTIIKFSKNIIIRIFNFLSIPFKFIYKIAQKLFFKPVSFVIINIRKTSTNLLKKIINISNNNKRIKNNVKN